MDKTTIESLAQRRWRRLLPWLLPAVFFAAAAVYGIRFEVNDDAIISCIASGAYGTDTVHLCYVNVLVGWLLRPFFALLPGFNWYALLLEGVNLAALWFLCRRSVARFGNAAGGAAFSVFMLLAGFNALQSLQYTKTAALAALAGVLLLAGHLGRERTVGWWAGALLLLAGACLRWEAFVAVGAIGAPLLLVRIFSAPKARARLRAGASLAFAVLVCFAAKGVDTLAYTGEWASYRAYNELRTRISDYGIQFVSEENAAQYGLSTADYYLVSTWDYGDTQLFSAERLAALGESLPHRTLANAVRETFKTLPRNLLDATDDSPLANRVGWLAAGVLAAWLCFGRRRAWGGVLGTFAVMGTLYYYLTWRGRMPFRIVWMLFVAAAVFALAVWAPRLSLGPSGLRRAAVCALALTAVGCYGAYATGLGNMLVWKADHTAATDAVYDEMSADKAHLYLLSTGQVDAIHGKDVWHTRPAGYFSNITFLGGWLAESPLYTRTAAAYGLSEGLLSGAVDNDRVYVVDFANIADKTDALREHLGLSVSAVSVDETHPNWKVYRLVIAR